MASSGLDRYLRIGIMTALMAAVVFVVGEGVYRSNAPATLPLTGAGDTPSIPTETGVFRLSREALRYRDTPETPPGGRELATFVARRAYPGAPPIIPHPLADAASFGGRTCLACHGDGGWVERFEAYAPVVPHPDLLNCLQCHVARQTEDLFRTSRFVPAPRPAIGRTALSGSPPPIPHDLFMRDNCLACHAGPGAVREIRVTHPERVNCRQCHAATAVVSPVFQRGVRRP